jgi:hypothetical protein
MHPGLLLELVKYYFLGGVIKFFYVWHEDCFVFLLFFILW